MDNLDSRNRCILQRFMDNQVATYAFRQDLANHRRLQAVFHVVQTPHGGDHVEVNMPSIHEHVGSCNPLSITSDDADDGYESSNSSIEDHADPMAMGAVIQALQHRLQEANDRCFEKDEKIRQLQDQVKRLASDSNFKAEAVTESRSCPSSNQEPDSVAI